MSMMPVMMHEQMWAAGSDDTGMTLEKLEPGGMTDAQCIGAPTHICSTAAMRLKIEACTSEEFAKLKRSNGGAVANAASSVGAFAAGAVNAVSGAAVHAVADQMGPMGAHGEAHKAAEAMRIKAGVMPADENWDGTLEGCFKAVDESGKVVYYFKGLEETLDSHGNKPKTHEERPQSVYTGKHLISSIVVMSPEGQNLFCIHGEGSATVFKLGGEKPEEVAWIKECRWEPFSSYTYEALIDGTRKQLFMCSCKTSANDDSPRPIDGIYAPVRKYEKAKGKDVCLAGDDKAEEWIAPETHAVAIFQYMKESPKDWTRQTYACFGAGMDVLGMLIFRAQVAVKCNKKGPKGAR